MTVRIHEEALQDALQEALQETLQEAPQESLQEAFQEALRRLQTALRRPWEDSLRQSGLGTTFEEKCTAETIVFFCKSGATDLFRRRVEKAKCTKYGAGAQKLFAVFWNFPGLDQGPYLPIPPEPLQIDLFGEFGEPAFLEVLKNQRF